MTKDRHDPKDRRRTKDSGNPTECRPQKMGDLPFNPLKCTTQMRRSNRRGVNNHPCVSRLAFSGVFVLSLALAACSQPTTQPLATSVPTIYVTGASVAGNATTGLTATTGPTATPSPVPPTPTPQPTATPVPPEPVTLAIVGEPETLHPLYATSRAAQTVVAALFVGCISPDERGVPVALGCEAVPTIGNGGAKFVGDGDERHLEVTFRIRQGWRWTDGTPVTAQDALYTWQLIMAPEGQLRDPLTQKVFSMAAPDDRTIAVSFMSAAQARAAAAGSLRGDVPFEYFTQLGDYARYAEQTTPLADADYWAVLRWLPAHLLKDVPPANQLESDFATKPVGDGAFEVSAWNKGTDITLVRSAEPFPLQPQGNVPGIIFKLAQDDAAAAQLVQDGGAQMGQPLSAAVISTGAVTSTPVAAPLVEQIVLNTSHFPFDDVKVRQALRLAVNVTEVMSDPSTGLATGAMVVDPDGLLRTADSARLLAGHDAAGAKALLTEAGWSCDVLPCAKAVTQENGTVVTRTLEFTLVTNERQPRNALSQLIQKQLAQAGFGVDLQIVHGLGKNSKLFASYEQGGILLTRNFDAAMYQAPSLTRLSGVFDCASIPSETATSPTQGNVFGYCDPATDALIAEAESGESAVSEAAHVKAVADALNAISDNALFVPLYSPLWAFPARDIAGVRFVGAGVETWNAWEWEQKASAASN
ncbi:MAG: ABC transporter substrate-binding protein [Chloroflexi bacterium]|nr:ABC transporter substrate-binding protein [Chloroflexota bacterium]